VVHLLKLNYINFVLVPVWKGYPKRALKEVHFFTKVPNTCFVQYFDNTGNKITSRCCILANRYRSLYVML